MSDDFWDPVAAAAVNYTKEGLGPASNGARHDGARSAVIRGELAFAESREVIDEGALPDELAIQLEEMTLAELIGGDTGDLRPELREERLNTLDTLMRYVCQDGLANPFAAFKNFLAAVRRVKPEYLDGKNGLSQTELAYLLGEGKAAVSAREKRQFEAKLRRWRVLGFHGLGGTKGEETRERCRQAQKGNRNRANGAARKRREEEKERKGKGKGKGSRAETGRRGG